RSPEIRRSEHARGWREIDVVEEVESLDAEAKVVVMAHTSLTTRTAGSSSSTAEAARTQAPAGASTAPSTAPTASRSAHEPSTRATSLDFRAEAKALRGTQIEREQGWTVAEVHGNPGLASCGIQVEGAIRSRNDISISGLGIGWSIIEKRVAVEILAYRHVE